MLHTKTSPIKIKWSTDEKPFQPSIYSYNVKSNDYETSLINIGDEIDAELSSERECIGYFNQPGYHKPCPNQETITSGSQCDTCERKDLFRPFVIGKQSFSKEKHHFFQENFYVYLALFGSNLKVGICNTDRYPVRCVDQGADKCTVIYEASDAEEALSIEDDVSSKSSIPDRIYPEIKQKQSGKDAASRQFATAKNTIQEKLDISPLDHNILKLTPHYPGSEKINNEYSLIYSSKSVTLNETVEAIKGQFIFTDKKRIINLSSYSGQVIKERKQQGLSDF